MARLFLSWRHREIESENPAAISHHCAMHASANSQKRHRLLVRARRTVEIEAIRPRHKVRNPWTVCRSSAGCVSRQWGRNQGRWPVKMQISPHDFPESRGKRVARGGGAHALQSRQMWDHERSIKDGRAKIWTYLPTFVHSVAEWRVKIAYW